MGTRNGGNEKQKRRERKDTLIDYFFASFAYRDVGKEREHAYMDVGSRVTQGAVAEDAEALRLCGESVRQFTQL